MELHVESAEGDELPPDCYIGVRIGEVLKQGRYEPQRSYNFPQVQQRRNAKIDVYQHIGSCVVSVDPDTKSIHEVKVVSSKPEYPGTTLKVSVQSRVDEHSKLQREDRKKALKNHSKDYLTKHCIEERLAEAVKALLKEQPEDATHFLCKNLGGLTSLETEIDALKKLSAELRKELDAVKPQLAEKDRVLAETVKTAAAEQLGEHERAIRETSRIAEDKINALQNQLAASLQEIETLKPALAKAEKLTADQQQQLAENERARRESHKLAEEKIEALKKDIRVLKSATTSNAAMRTMDTEDQKPTAPSPAKTAEMAELRKQAANILMASNEDGSLTKALMEVRGPPISETDGQQTSKSESSRLRAAQVLMEGAESGKLEEALLEVSQRNEQRPKDSNKDDVRLKAAALLSDAAENGSLKEILLETKGAAKDLEKTSQAPHVIDVRERAGGLLKSAAQDGRLESALKEIKKPAVAPVVHDVESYRARAANLMKNAANNGELEAALKQIKKDASKTQNGDSDAVEKNRRQKGEDVRLKTQKLLLQSCDDGSLGTILRDLKGESKPSQDTERIRMKAASMLLQAEENGSLEGVLREVKGEAKPRQDEKQQGASCHVCGNVYMDDAVFCRKCGSKRLAPATAEAPSPATNAATTDAPGSVNDESVRMKAGNLLFAAADNGDLKRVLQEVKDEKKKEEQRTDPPVATKSIDSTAGMQPGLMFI